MRQTPLLRLYLKVKPSKCSKKRSPKVRAVMTLLLMNPSGRERNFRCFSLRVKFKTPPGEQFVVRREVYKRIQERFREEGIEFAHRNVTVYLPPEFTGAGTDGVQGDGHAPDNRLLGASAAAALAASQADESKKKP